MAADTELDRNEAATPHKLSEARKKGQVARSADVVSAVVFAAAVAYLYAQGWEMLRAQFLFDRHVFAHAADLGATPAALWHLIGTAVRESLLLLAPLLATIVLASLIANIGQTGGIFSAHPVKPDWDRVNPANGLKRLFSVRTLFDTLRTCAKLLVLSWVVYAALKALLPQFYALAGLPPLGQARQLVANVAGLGLNIALALAVIAAIDFGWSRREFAKRLRMSRRELKEEFKNREGDPRIRARLRELRREMLKRSLALKRTGEADLLVTNPTHYAIALRYRHGEMAAPRLVAKGAGTMAAAMRAIAARHRIPVVQNVTLARALYAHAGLDEDLPSVYFPEVARLMVWVLAMRDARHRPAGRQGATA
jgi:flagellar biosynthetic protein FlhB